MADTEDTNGNGSGNGSANGRTPPAKRAMAAKSASTARGASAAARGAAAKRASAAQQAPAPAQKAPAQKAPAKKTSAKRAPAAKKATPTPEPTRELVPAGRVQTITTTPARPVSSNPAAQTAPTTQTPTTQTRPAPAVPTGRPEDSYTVVLPPVRKRRPWDPITNQFIFFGDFLLFMLRAIAAVPVVLTRYRKEYVRLIGDVTFGSKALAVLASTVMVAAVLSAVVGVQLALEGYQGLDVIGLGPLAGYLSAFANTRELTPLLTGFGLAAQMGCRFTSELGAQAVTDEIAALEVMSVPSLAYLVTTRIMAALTVTIPLFLLALAGSYLATQLTVVAVAHQGSGTYLHYFHEFLAGKDIILATIKVIVFAVFITSIHCFYGYTTTGGPENVGKSTGRAIRASIVAIAVTDMLMTILFWGTSSGIKITG